MSCVHCSATDFDCNIYMRHCETRRSRSAVTRCLLHNELGRWSSTLRCRASEEVLNDETSRPFLARNLRHKSLQRSEAGFPEYTRETPSHLSLCGELHTRMFLHRTHMNTRFAKARRSEV